MKKLIWIWVLFFVFFNHIPIFADESGTLVSAPITKGSDLNNYPSAFCKESKGCPQTVIDNTARNAILSSVRVVGLTAYITSTGKTWQLKNGITNSDWIDITNSGISGSISSNVDYNGYLPVYVKPPLLEEAMIANDAYANTQANMAAFCENSIISNGTTQFGAYWRSDLKMVLWQRTLPDGPVTKYAYDGTGGRPSIGYQGIDYHECIGIGRDPTGKIHVAYAFHGAPLKYRRSTNADDVSSLSNPIANMVANNPDIEAYESYPKFFNSNSGTLYYTTRALGGTGDANQYMYVYNSGTTTWSPLPGLNADGFLINGKSSSPTRNPYIWGPPAVDSQNNFQIAGSWRITSITFPSLHDDIDPYYFKYNTATDTFVKAGGATQTIPVTPGNAGNIFPAPVDQLVDGLSSMNSIDVDGNDYPHVTYAENDSNGNSQVWHAWYNGSAWVIKQLTTSLARHWAPNTGISPFDASTRYPDTARPEIAIDRDRNIVYIITKDMSASPGIIVLESAPGDFTTWRKYLIYQGELGYWEPTYDKQEWKANKVLYIPVQEISQNINGISIAPNAMYSVIRWKPSEGGRIPFTGGDRKNIWTNNDWRVTTEAGGIWMSPFNGILTLSSSKAGEFNTGANNKIVIKDSTRSNYVSLTHDGSNGTFETNLGDFVFQGTSSGVGNVGVGTYSSAYKLHVDGSNTSIIQAVNTAPDTTTSGANIAAVEDPGAALGIGHRIGLFLAGGAKDSSHTIAITAGMEALTSQAWSSTAAGTYLVFRTTPNDSTTRLTRMAIGQDGNVGIGSATPKTLLDVQGTTSITNGELDTYGTGNAVRIHKTTDDTVTAAELVGGSASGALRIYTNGTKVAEIHGSAGTPTFFNAGNVGIGTSIPSSPLTIYSLSSPNLKAIDTEAGSSSSGANLAVYSDPGAVLTSEQRLGLHSFGGAINNSHSLGIAAAIGSFARETFSASAIGGDLRFYTVPTGGNTALVENMRIMPSGNVGIGSTAPTVALDVNGTGKFVAIQTSGIGPSFVQGAGTTMGITFQTKDSSGAVTTTVLDNGNVGIGSTFPSAKLAVIGQARVWTGSGTINNATGSGSLYVQNNLEVDGSLYGNGANITGITGGTECSSSSCDLNAATTIASTTICRSDGTNCVAGTGGGWTDGGTFVYLGTASDNVGVGTSATGSNKLTIKGNGTTTAPTLQLWDSAASVKTSFLDNGNIGIGTTIPSQKLTIANADTTTYTTTGSSNTNIFLVNSSQTANDFEQLIFGVQNDAGNNTSTARIGAINSAITAGSESGSLTFGTKNVGTTGERMRITNGGNVGIGTSSYTGRLIVQGSGTSTGVTFQLLSSTPTARVTALDNGNVGVGTTVPARLLSIRGGDLSIAGTAPTLSSCGTSPSVAGSDNNFEITVGATASGCTATFATAKTNAPVCTVTNQSMSVVNALSYTISTSAVTISQTGLGGALVDVLCIPRD